MLPSLPLSLGHAYLFTFIGALSMVGGVTLLRARGWTTPLVGRKLMHMATGPVFVLCWLLFPESTLSLERWISPLLAATVPFAVSIYFFLCGVGRLRNSPLVQTVARSGDKRELLAGPFWYGILHAIAAAFYWRHRPTGVVGLLTLCLGDGVADLFGRRYGRTKWPHNREKSVQGSIAFVAAALPACWIMCDLMALSSISSSFHSELTFVVIIAALVESLPLQEHDNLAVFASVAAMGHWLHW